MHHAPCKLAFWVYLGFGEGGGGSAARSAWQVSAHYAGFACPRANTMPTRLLTVTLDLIWRRKTLRYHDSIWNTYFCVFMVFSARIFLQAKQAAKTGFPTSYEGYFFIRHAIDRGPGPLPASTLKKKYPLKHPGNRHFVTCLHFVSGRILLAERFI